MYQPSEISVLYYNVIIFPGLFGLMGVVYNITIVAKKIIFYMWPAGLAGYLGGIIYIDRKDGKTAYKQLQEISHALTHNQVTFSQTRLYYKGYK